MRRPALLLIVTAFVISCSDNSEDTLMPIREGLTVGVQDMYPAYTPYNQRATPVPTVVLTTRDIYRCGDEYVVTYQVLNERDSVISIHVRGVGSGVVCFDYPLPAVGEIPLVGFRGVYTLEIEFLGQQDRYRLNIAGDRILLSPQRALFSAPSESLAWRYVPNSFCIRCAAYVYGETDSLCLDFFNSLSQAVDISEIEQPVSGVWPYQLPTVYRCAHGDCFNEVRAVIRSFSSQLVGDPPEITIYAISWRNEVSTSWQPSP